MKLNDFLSAVGGIDEDLVEPVAESRTNDKKNPVRFAILIAAVAAAVVTVAAFSLALGMRGPAVAPTAPAEGTESRTNQITETEPYVIADTKTDTDTEKSTETGDDTIETDPPRQKETGKQTESGSSGDASMTTPNLSFTLYASSEIVRGTVVGKGVTRQSNPTGEGINGMGESIPRDGVISFYDLSVEEVFKGNVRPGDVIRIFSVALIVDPDDEAIPYRLNAGQTGIFCIYKDDIWTDPSDGPAYGIVEGARGVFDRVDGDGIYHSNVYDLDPADLPALIAAADEQWVPIYEQYANNPI